MSNQWIDLPFVSASIVGSVTVLQGTSPWVISGTVTTIPSGTQDVNLTKINGNTALAGNGVTGTGSLRVTIASDNTAFSINAIQSGTWTTGRTWSLSSGSDSVSCVQSTSPWVISGSISFTAPQHVILDSGVLTSITNNVTVVGTGTFAVQAAQSGTWTVQQGSPPWSVSQSGTWTTGRTWTLSSGTDSISVIQSGTWNIGTVTAVTSITNPVSLQTTTSGTPSGVTVSTSSILIKALNTNRKSIIITNNGTGSLYLGHTSGVTTSGATMGLIIVPNGSYTDSGSGLYTGDLYGIYSQSASTQNISVSERT